MIASNFNNISDNNITYLTKTKNKGRHRFSEMSKYDSIFLTFRLMSFLLITIIGGIFFCLGTFLADLYASSYKEDFENELNHLKNNAVPIESEFTYYFFCLCVINVALCMPFLIRDLLIFDSAQTASELMEELSSKRTFIIFCLITFLSIIANIIIGFKKQKQKLFANAYKLTIEINKNLKKIS